MYVCVWGGGKGVVTSIVGQQSVFVAFPGHTHLLFTYITKYIRGKLKRAYLLQLPHNYTYILKCMSLFWGTLRDVGILLAFKCQPKTNVNSHGVCVS